MNARANSQFMQWVRRARNVLLLLFASYVCAIFINAKTNIWAAIEHIPAPMFDAIARTLMWISQPLQPDGVHEQEEYLELLIVWFCTLPVVIPALMMARAAALWLGGFTRELIRHCMPSHQRE